MLRSHRAPCLGAWHVPGAPEGVDRPRRTLGLLEVNGWVSGPFGIYSGFYLVTEHPEKDGFTLVHLPTNRMMLHLRRLKLIKAAADELATLCVRWACDDPNKVILGQPDEHRFPEIMRRLENSDKTPEEIERCRYY